MNCRTYPGADCDTDHQLLVAMLKVRLGKRQRENSIPPLNLEELKEDKAVQFAAEVTNRFTALEAAQNEVTPEDLWKVTSKKCIAVCKVATPLRELTCHMRSHSVTCHPAEVTFPPLPQPKLVLD